jgi:hypothetical protein
MSSVYQQPLLSITGKMCSMTMMMMMAARTIATLLIIAPWSVMANTGVGGNQHILMDPSGSLRLKIPSIPTSRGVVSIITSPGTTSYFTSLSQDSDSILTLLDDDVESSSGDDASSATTTTTLICRGATLKGTSSAERSALSTTSWVSDAIVVDGITAGDVEAAGWRNTRHARSLTAIFRSRLMMMKTTTTTASPRRKQALILCVKVSNTDSSSSPSLSSLEPALQKEIRALFEATAAETNDKNAFDSLYDVTVVSVRTHTDAEQVRFVLQNTSSLEISIHLLRI